MAYGTVPWYELKGKPGVKVSEVMQAYEAEEAAKEAAEAKDPARALSWDSELYEQEEEGHLFHRWLNYVEPRIGLSGDLSLLQIGQQEILKLIPLDGRSAPSMRGAWEPLGPFATGTAGAGRLNWIEFHSSDKNIMMVGSPGGGLWMTRDAGKTWSTTTDKIAVLGAAWAVFHPANPETIFLGTGDGDAGDSKSIGLLKSTDGGKTWNTTGLTYPVSGSTQISKVLIDPRNGNNLFVGASNGLQVSTDGGVTFKAATGITGKVWDVEMHPTNSKIIYASTTSFHVSTDGGATFTRITSLATAGSRMQLAVTNAEPEYVYALRGAQSSTQGVHRSTNAGQTFTQMGSGSTIGCSQTWYDYGFGASHTNANELAAGCLNIFRSTDGGANWNTAGSGYHVDIHATTYRDDGVLFTANDGGVWQNTTGNTWVNLNNNLNISQGYRLGVFPGDYDQVCTGRQDNGTDIRAGSAGFKRALGADGMECFWNSTGTRWYGESQNGGFSNCNYSNGTVSGCTRGAPSAGGSWDTPWGADPTNPSVVYAGRGSNMWKSSDNGGSWIQMGSMSGSAVRNFVVAPSNSQVIYAFKGTDIMKTADGGGSWQSVKGTVSGTIMNGAVSAADPNDIWVAVSGYTATTKVFHSANGGQSWTNETLSGLPNVPANTVALDNLGKNGVYVGMDAGVYFKRDGMAQWENFSDGLPNSSVRELEIGRKGTTSDRRLLASTYGRGVWSTRLWDNVTSVEPRARLPALRHFSTALSGSRLKVHFQLGTDKYQEGMSTIQLATVDGKVVFTDEVPNFGVFDRQIDLSRQGKGIYLFVLKNRQLQAARRVAVQ